MLQTMTLKDQKGEEAMGEDEFELDTEGQPGERKTKNMQHPKMPTRTEIEEHKLTHLPFRSWCRHCVPGREKQSPHKRVGEQGEMPELHVDMCFSGEDKERSTRMTMATVVPAWSARSFASRMFVYSLQKLAGEVGPGAGCQGDRD